MQTFTRTYSKSHLTRGVFAHEDKKQAGSFIEKNSNGDIFVEGQGDDPKTKVRHYETQIQPSSPMGSETLLYLRACADYQGTASYGKVHVLLEKSFWKWLRESDSSLIRQAYIDAAFILGYDHSELADRATLMTEVFGPNNISTNASDTMNQRRERAQAALVNTGERLSSSRFARISKEERAEYAALGNGADLKRDFDLFKRARAFEEQMVTLTLLDGPAYSQAALQKQIWKSEKEGQLMVVALKRLAARSLQG